MLLRFALRNIRRNLRASVLTLLSIAAGVGVIVFLRSVQDGYVAQRLDAGLSTWQGHMSVRAGDEGVHDTDVVIAALEADPDVLAAAPRIEFEGFVRGALESQGVRLFGVDAEAESRVTRLPHMLVEGVFLPTPGPREPPPIVLGEGLAETLDVRPGENVSLLVEGHDGALVADLFWVSGCFRTGVARFDDAVAYIPRVDARRLVALPGEATEVVARVREPLAIGDVLGRVGPELPELRVLGWHDTAPELLEALEVLRVLERFRMLFLFGLVGLGIFNTVTLAVLERRREFGVLMAMGMGPGALLRCLLIETGLLAAGGLVIGIGGAALVGVVWLGQTGLDVEALGASLPGALEGTRVIYPLLQVRNAVSAAVWVTVVTFVVLVLPAARLLRLDPAVAVRGR